MLAYIWLNRLKKAIWTKTTKVFLQENEFENDNYKIINYILKFKWNLHEDATIALQENEFEIVAYKTAVILCRPEYINCVWGEIAAMFWHEVQKKIQKLYQRKSFENVSKMTDTLSRPECVNTLWPKLNYLHSEECVSKFIWKRWLWNNSQGAVSIRKTVLPGMAIPMLKIRRPNGRLIFNMEITIRR